MAPHTFGQAAVTQISLKHLLHFSPLCLTLGQPSPLHSLLIEFHDLHYKCTRQMGVNITRSLQTRGPVQGCLPNCWRNPVSLEADEFSWRRGELDKQDQGHTLPLIPNVARNSKGFWQEERHVCWNKNSIFTVLISTTDDKRSWKAFTSYWSAAKASMARDYNPVNICCVLDSDLAACLNFVFLRLQWVPNTLPCLCSSK